MEAFLGLVSEKIVVALASEALNALGYVTNGQRLQLAEVNEMMRRIRSEFEHIQTFISTVELHKYGPTIDPWVKRAREIGESMEDVIDQYLYLSAEQSQAAILYYPFGRCYILGSNPWSDIDTRLKKIEFDLGHLKEMKKRYDITKVQSSQAGSSATTEVAADSNVLKNDPASLDPASYGTSNEDAITLFDEERGKLIEWLKNDQTERVVIVVWGMGGLGKTTLVENVYNSKEIDAHFDYTCWVTVSKYDTDELLRRLLKNFLPSFAQDRINMKDRDSLIRDVKFCLAGEHYLLVLDDVRMESGFMELMQIIPDDLLQSRVVVTTRSLDTVGVQATGRHTIELRELKDDQAWNLFCREAFRKGTNIACIDNELRETGKNIVKKCGGLPLAIVAIARLMSLKQQDATEWQRVLSKLSWEFKNNPKLGNVNNVLNLSFDDLPSYLRNCFLYCTVIPASGIERSKLIQLWVAESFIQDRGLQTKEEVAEEFFNELVHRSMLQVVERNRYGKVRRCRIHELVLENILSTARNERFSIVWKESEPSQLGEDARRLSVHNCTTKQSILFKLDFSRIRSLFIFDYNQSTEGLLNSVSSAAKYLRVLDLENADISKIPSALTDLFNLHYLGLRATKVKRLPRSIGKLRNLLTLDVRYTKVEKLPKAVNQLKNLRHLLNKVNDENRRGTMHSYRFVRSPHGIWNLKSLQRLSLAVDEATVSQLGNLTALRILKMANVKQSYYGKLSISLSHMPLLYKLSIIAADESEVLGPLNLTHVFKNLHKLHLHGRLAEPVLPAPQTIGLKLLFSRMTHGSSGGTPPFSAPRDVMQQMGVVDCQGYKLSGLCLSWCGLKDDPLPLISRLGNLTVLKLKDTSDAVELRFKEKWFPKLKELHLLKFKHLNRIIVEKDALKSLEVWAMVGLSKLMLLPKAIESLKELNLLSVSECNPIFLYEIHKSVDQIPRIEHKYEVDGKWITEPLSRPRAAAPSPPLRSQSRPPSPPLRSRSWPPPLRSQSRPPPSPSQPSPPHPASAQPSPPHPASVQPSPSLFASPQPQEVPDNPVPSPSMRQIKLRAELPNAGSSLPDVNIQDPMLDEVQIGVPEA